MRCDSHIHVVGLPERYPQVPNRTYLAGLATLADVKRAAAARRAALRHRAAELLRHRQFAAAAKLGCAGRERARRRGIEPGMLTTRELLDLASRGVRGLRINLYSPLGKKASLQEHFNEVDVLARHLNWHIEVIAPLKFLAQESALLAHSTVPVVIDHYGLYTVQAPHGGEGKALIELVTLRHVWMKLSAPYRSSYDPLAMRPDPIWLEEFLKAAPERCVWGSDWPHTPPHEKQGDSKRTLPYRALALRDGRR